MHRLRIITAATLALLAAAPVVLHAQTVARPAAVSIPHVQVVSGNPLGLAFGVLSGEYEKKFRTNTTIGAAASFYAPEDWSYLSAEGKYRYYPQGVALKGFSIGGTGGFTRIASRISDDVRDYCGSFGEDCSDVEDGSATALTIGVELDYQWLLGEKQNFAVTGGLGAKRFVYLGDGLNGASGGMPVVRLSVGYAF